MKLFAGALQAQGVAKGDRVIIYMPAVPEAVIAMLACARIGAIHSVVFGGFAPRELAIRLDDCTPKLIVSASCGIEPTRTIPYKPLLDEAIEIASHKPQGVIVLQRPQVKATLLPGRDHDWDELMARARPADCVPVAATPAPRLVVPLTETSVTPVISPPTTAFPLIASARPPPASVDDVVIVVPARVVFAASETASP